MPELVHYAVIDAFTNAPFKGNPAAVCLLEEEKDDEWMQLVAAEFNISETCFLMRSVSDDTSCPRFRLRWFTPVTEVDLCGHATLAAAHFLFTSDLVQTNRIEFLTRSGILTTKKIPLNPCSGNGTAKKDFSIEMDFPVSKAIKCDPASIPSIPQTLNDAPVVNIYKTTLGDFIVELVSGMDVTKLQPNIEELRRCGGRGVIITGPAPEESEYDFFTRFFAPNYGVNEDPVCGSAHCALAPYWSKKTRKAQSSCLHGIPKEWTP